MARSGRCQACGAVIRPRAKDMSVAAASRLHYWKHHRDVMMAGVAKRQRNRARAKSRAKQKGSRGR
jgi:hypothetical protein